MKINSSIHHLLEWRKAHPEHEKNRLEAVKNSEKIKAAARRVGVQYKKKAMEIRSKNPRMQKGESHCASLFYEIRSPKGVRYSGYGLAHFVRMHEHLFLPEQVIWKAGKNKKGKTLICRAYSGLSSLRQKSKTMGSWFGWTWTSKVEMVENQSEDILNRKQNL